MVGASGHAFRYELVVSRRLSLLSVPRNSSLQRRLLICSSRPHCLFLQRTPIFDRPVAHRAYMAQCHASCHEVQSRRQERIKHNLTGNTGISLTYLACFSSPLSVRFPEMGQFSWEKSVKSCTVMLVLSCPARISPYFALHDSLRDTGPPLREILS